MRSQPCSYRVIYVHSSRHCDLTRRSPATPRFTGDRRSEAINWSQAQNIIAGAVHAAVIGQPLNRFITVHWEAGGVPCSPRPTTQFLKLAGDWLAQQGAPRTWVWARETGDDKGGHVHILAHVPPLLSRTFANRQRKWLALCGADFDRGVIKSRAIGFSYQAAGAGPLFSESYTANLLRTVDYVLKGADQAAAETLGLVRKRSSEGVLLGKRTATSKSVGLKARKTWTLQHPEQPAADGMCLDQIISLTGPAG